MRDLGQLCLLAAFVSSGCAAFACIVGRLRGHRAVARGGQFAAVASVATLTATLVILGWALVAKDFRFRYVTEYSSGLLAWHYSLAALWVGQAGSLLLWAWFVGVLALAYFFWPRGEASTLRTTALGVMMAFQCFLLAIMVFAADPMEPSLVIPKEGAGLGPLLHHPAMLVHPPIVFLGYAAWTVPFALAIAALLARGAGFQAANGWAAKGQVGNLSHNPSESRKLDAGWAREARPWALLAWTVLGVGILLGASWAYEELGWGGYWGWDPVENGSLIPWLTGSAFIHSLMAWRYCGVLKKTAVSLAIATFGFCNFATFLTRSGIFSSVHAFSQSPIGWMFLILMAVLAVAGATLVFVRRRALAADRTMTGVWTREAFVTFSGVLLLLLATVTTLGTLTGPLSKIVLGRQVSIGPAFYNNVLVPIGLLLLAAIAVAPVLRWGKPPTPQQVRLLLTSALLGLVGAAVAFCLGVRHPIGLAVTWAATLTVAAIVGALILDVRWRDSGGVGPAILRTLRDRRREYAGYLIHVGFVCVAIGVTGSSLGTQRREVVMSEGESIQWAGRTIRYDRLIQRELPDKLVAEVVLQVSRSGGTAHTLSPARHLHRLQNEWTTEVAIHSTWGGDLYTILNSGEGDGRVSLTLVDNPLMRWLWLGGGVVVVGSCVAAWPTQRSTTSNAQPRQPTASVRYRRLEVCVISGLDAQ